MKYLLDTHIILWALIDDQRLSIETKNIILNPDHSIYYSTVSPWEVEIKHLKDPNFQLSGEQLAFLCDQNGLLNLPVQNEHILELMYIFYFFHYYIYIDNTYNLEIWIDYMTYLNFYLLYLIMSFYYFHLISLLKLFDIYYLLIYFYINS